MLAAGVARRLRQLVRLGAVDPAVVGEEQDPLVRGGGEEVLHHVVGPQGGAAHALASALLRPVLVGAGALGVAAAGDRDDHVLLGDQVLHGHVPVEGHDLGAAVVAVLVDDLGQLLGDQLALAGVRGQDRVVLVDERGQAVVLLHDLLALQGGQAAQLQAQDRVGLHAVDVQQLHQARAGLVGVGRATDQGDDLVQRIQRLEVAAVDVDLLLGLAQAEAGAADDDVDLVLDPLAHEHVDRQGARHAVDQRQHVRGEVLLQLRVLVEVVEHHLGDGVALEHEHEALAGAARGLIADVGDALQLAQLDLLGDLAGQRIGVDLVRQLGDDQAHAPADLLRGDDGALGDRAAARAVGVLDALLAQDRRAGREVGALDAREARVQQLLLRGLVVRQQPLGGVGHLAQVVRRDVRGHADGDAGRPVDQQVREARGQDGRLLQGAVIVVAHVDGVLVDPAHQLDGQRRHLALGVTVRGGAVVAGRAEVALAEDQRVAHVPRLDQAHHGVVDRAVAVRVVVAHHVADDLRALGERALGAVAAVVHAVDDAAVDRLEAVPHVREGAVHDHAHRVVEEGSLHLLVEVDLRDVVALVDGIDERGQRVQALLLGAGAGRGGAGRCAGQADACGLAVRGDLARAGGRARTGGLGVVGVAGGTEGGVAHAGVLPFGSGVRCGEVAAGRGRRAGSWAPVARSRRRVRCRGSGRPWRSPG